MSFIAKIKGKVKDLAALRMATERLGGTMTEGKTYTWEGRQQAHDAQFVLRFAKVKPTGAYAPQEIGVVPEKDGYALSMSSDRGGICSVVGDPLYKDGENILAPILMQQYQMCAVANEARRQGADVREYMEAGLPRLEITQPEYASL